MNQLEGIVISGKMPKTAVVKIVRLTKHPLYKKKVKRSKRYLVDDQIGVKKGEKVKIVQTRPISKRKRWKIVEVLKKKEK